MPTDPGTPGACRHHSPWCWFFVQTPHIPRHHHGNSIGWAHLRETDIEGTDRSMFLLWPWLPPAVMESDTQNHQHDQAHHWLFFRLWITDGHHWLLFTIDMPPWLAWRSCHRRQHWWTWRTLHEGQTPYDPTYMTHIKPTHRRRE